MPPGSASESLAAPIAGETASVSAAFDEIGACQDVSVLDSTAQGSLTNSSGQVVNPSSAFSFLVTNGTVAGTHTVPRDQGIATMLGGIGSQALIGVYGQSNSQLETANATTGALVSLMLDSDAEVDRRRV